MKKDFILELYKRQETVFTLKGLSIIFPKISYKNLKRKINYYVKAEKLKRLRRGVYAKDNFNPLELANKIYSPSYISLETVLQKAGIIFQEYKEIFVISYLTRKIKAGGKKIIYRKIKDEILLDKTGIKQKNCFFIASAERAFLDAVFLYKDYHFDNLGPLEWEKVNKIKEVYANKALEKRIKDYYKIYKEKNV